MFFFFLFNAADNPRRARTSKGSACCYKGDVAFPPVRCHSNRLEIRPRNCFAGLELKVSYFHSTRARWRQPCFIPTLSSNWSEPQRPSTLRRHTPDRRQQPFARKVCVSLNSQLKRGTSSELEMNQVWIDLHVDWNKVPSIQRGWAIKTDSILASRIFNKNKQRKMMRMQNSALCLEDSHIAKVPWIHHRPCSKCVTLFCVSFKLWQDTKVA